MDGCTIYQVTSDVTSYCVLHIYITGDVTLWFKGLVVQWIVGWMVGWIGDSVVRWFDGSLVQWIVGSMVRWIGGSVVCWFAGSMDRWFDGLVVRWFDGSVVRWFGGSMDRWFDVGYFRETYLRQFESADHKFWRQSLDFVPFFRILSFLFASVCDRLCILLCFSINSRVFVLFVYKKVQLTLSTHIVPPLMCDWGFSSLVEVS